VDVEKKERIDYPISIKEEELSFYKQLVDKKGRAKKRVPSAHLSETDDRATTEKVIEKVKQDTYNYSVQVAALKDKGETEKMVARLTRLGYRAYYSLAMVNGQMFYRVRCGPFPSLKEAKKKAKQLTNREGFKPFMVYHDKN